jgi:hypothetical protein
MATRLLLTRYGMGVTITPMQTGRLTFYKKAGKGRFKNPLPIAFCILLFTFLAVREASAFGTQGVQVVLPVSSEAHGESDGTAGMPPHPHPGAGAAFKATLDFSASENGGVELLFGMRDPQGGGLDYADAAFSVGFDSGRWLVRYNGLRQEAAQDAATAAMSPRSLVIRMRLRADGTPSELLSFSVDGEAFTALADGEIRGLFSPHRFDAFRVSARGDAHPVSASVTLSTSPSLIIIR